MLQKCVFFIAVSPSGCQPVHTGAVSVLRWVESWCGTQREAIFLVLRHFFIMCHRGWWLRPTSKDNSQTVYWQPMERRPLRISIWSWGMEGRPVRFKSAVSFWPERNALTHHATDIYGNTFLSQASSNPRYHSVPFLSRASLILSHDHWSPFENML